MAVPTRTRKPSAAQPELADKDTLPHDPQTAGQADPDFLQALEALTVPELNQVLKRAQALRDAKLDSAKQDFVARMKAEGEQLGLNLGSLFGRAAPAERGRKAAGEPKSERPPVLPKYRSPNGDEWSGRGRMPKWLQAAEAEGKGRDEFLIDKPA